MDFRQTNKGRLLRRGGVGRLLLAGAALWLTGCVAGGAGAGVSAAASVPDRVERHGEFEVVIHTRHRRNANNGDVMADESWSLRRNGEAVIFDSYGGMWLDQPLRTGALNALFLLGTGGQPEFLVNVGDPNNASLFHLLHLEAGQVVAPLVCRSFGGNNGVRVLRSGVGADQLFSGPHYRSLGDARHLLLGDACLYDIATRHSRELQRPPEGVAFPPGIGGSLLSPDGRSLARAALLTENESATLLVADLDSGHWSDLPIDPLRMRYAQFAAIDAAWIAHHFEWRRIKGRDRLAERSRFQPLPWRGSFMAGQAQYELRQAQGDQRQRLAQFMVRRFGAKPLPDPSGGSGAIWRYEIEGVEVSLFANGFFIARSGRPYTPGTSDDPAWQQQLARRIGEAFDQELAAGLHEEMFTSAQKREPH